MVLFNVQMESLETQAKAKGTEVSCAGLCNLLVMLA